MENVPKEDLKEYKKLKKEIKKIKEESQNYDKKADQTRQQIEAMRAKIISEFGAEALPPYTLPPAP